MGDGIKVPGATGTGKQDLAARLSLLSPEKRALLERKLAGRADRGITPLPPDAPRALAIAQQRLWFIAQLDPDSVAYNTLRAVRLRGRLDTRALEGALNDVIQRHEVLRTNYLAVNGQPVLVVSPERVLALPVTEVAGAGDSDVQRLAREEMRRPFDLASDLLVRARLLRLGPEEHVLLLVIHHIVFDGWSVSILNRELAACYTARTAGNAPSLPPLPIQYADYAAWQRDWFQGERLAEQLTYWKGALAGLPDLQLSCCRPRPPIKSHHGARRTAKIPRDVRDGLQALSRAQNVTLFMTLLAAFYTLLYRYSGQEDLAVGTPIAQRARSEAESLIGFFVNTLVLRADLSGAPTFRELLGRVRDVAFSAYAHQELPFEKVVEELHTHRDLSRTPLTKIVFNFRNLPPREAKMGEVRMEPIDLDDGIARFDLMLVAREEYDGLTCIFEYDTELFDEADIDRMLVHLGTLLDGIVADPDRPLAALPLLTPEETHRLLAAWNDTSRDYPRDATLHGLFAEQAAHAPDAVALICSGERMTYAALDRRANRLAHLLRDRQVSLETPVGVFLHRSLDMIVALLAILKAGGAYVPLDPAYPRDRLLQAIDDSGMPLVVTHRLLGADLPGGVAQVRLDEEKSVLAAQPDHAPETAGSAEHLAYIIYTSGSTGAPKGVAMPHRGVVRLLHDREFLPVQADDATLFFRTLAFDISELEIWGALVHGARLVIMPESLETLNELRQAVEREGITVLSLPTSLLQPLLRHGCESLRGLRALVVGGDVMPVPAAERAARELSCRVINAYGPTEGAVYATAYEVPAGARFTRAVPIGRPLANTTVYVLDAQRQPVPIGVTGELFLGGDCLARGYYRRPALTAERFIPNPFSPDLADRLYRTGDLARWLPDGNLDFVGRADVEVKVRGYRVDLGDVESVLGRHPAVRECMAIVREDTPGVRRLVAYAVPEPGQACTAEGLRAHLRATLPEYTVPAAFVILPELPLTPVGKVDRRALPPPALPEDVMPSGPRTPSERLLARIWGELFGLDTIDLSEHFMDLGGHSLMAMQVIARVREELGIKLAVADVFSHPTIRELGEHLARQAPDRLEAATAGPDDGAALTTPATIHACFAAQAARAPDAIALTSGDERITYGELNRRAETLAHELLALGVEHETPVGLCLERSPGMIVALLAILKAGGAYVPLDPDDPDARLEFVIQDVCMPVILTRPALRSRFAGCAAHVLCLEAGAEGAGSANGEALPEIAGAESLAYVLYTSGSTGQPKGVAVPHRGVLRLVRGADYLDFRRDDVFLQFAPLGFDASTFEIWGPLLNGARLVLMPSELAALEALGPVIQRERVTVLWLTASLFNLLVDEDVAALRGLRALLTGGEALSVPHMRRACQALPDCRLINGYGPTENTTFTCCFPVPEGYAFTESVPIGRPIAGTTVYLLDEAMQPVSPGEVGELYTGGKGLAREYWKRMDLTAERFIADPFRAEPGARLYRTGDLARQLPDGTFDFVARMDDQVKIHGYRIELGEIEAALAEHPLVRQCCVLARQDARDEKQLVACVVLHPGHSVSTRAVRAFLQERLPEYMLPAAIVCLPDLPLTASGKIDRQALSLLIREQGEGAAVGARDALERQLVSIWEETIGVAPVGIHDDFFDLGGHSLLAVRLFALIEKRIGRRLPLATLFEAATVADISALLRQEGWTPPWSSLVPIQPGGSLRPFFCIHPAGGDILVYRELSRLLGDDQPFYGFQEDQHDANANIQDTVEEMAAYYIRQLRDFQPEGPYLLGGYSFGGIVAFEMARQLKSSGAEVGLLALFDTGCPNRRRLTAATNGPLAFLGKYREMGLLQFLRSRPASLARAGVRLFVTGLYHWCRLIGRPLPVRFRKAGRFLFYQLARKRYHPTPYPGDLTLFRVTGSPLRPTPEGDLGWSDCVGGRLDILTMPGHHDEVFADGHVEVLAAQLRACLLRAQDEDHDA